MNLFHDHVEHLVTITEVVVEGKGHTVLDAALYEYIMDGIYELGAVRIDHALHLMGSGLILMAVEMVGSLEYFLTGCL